MKLLEARLRYNEKLDSVTKSSSALPGLKQDAIIPDKRSHNSMKITRENSDAASVSSFEARLNQKLANESGSRRSLGSSSTSSYEAKLKQKLASSQVGGKKEQSASSTSSFESKLDKSDSSVSSFELRLQQKLAKK